VIKVPALLFLFLVQFILIFMGLAVFLFIRHRKLDIKATILQGEIRRLESELDRQKEEIEGLLGWPKMFSDLQQKFEQVQGINTRLKESVEALVPEAQRSKEFEQLIAEIDHHNNELNTCVGALQNENESLTQRMISAARETEKLSGKLRESVKKEDYQRLESEKNGLELKVAKLREELDSKTKDCERLEKNFIYLEKEYNALYKNIKGEEP